MKKWIGILLSFFLFTKAEATKVKSTQDGDFFMPGTWENNQVPDLSADSIIIEHHLSFNQDFQLSGTAYLHIKVCAFLCGNFDFFMRQNTYVFCEGELFTSDIRVEGHLYNQGFIECTRLGVGNGGRFANGTLGFARVRLVVHDCLNKAKPENLARVKKSSDSSIVIYMKCYSEIDFGDGSDSTSASDSVTHTYSRQDSFTVSITTYCPCDTAFIQEKLAFSPPPPAPEPPCETKFSFYPNPNNGQFTVNLERCDSTMELLSVPFYNSAGQLICSIDLNQNGETQIKDLVPLASGVYYLALPGSTGVKPQKVVIIK